ncbi:MAG: IclR family transcriptional regulator [Deltaproteobacteria bacterium]|nr:IclR family transcriptional regulator [Deltaproteobacteria bacterium]MBI3076354.1 IclR family transcriptional regulator [Deltaproteobacteria bacterium]
MEQSIRVLDRAVAIVEALADAGRPIGVSDLSGRVGLSKGTTHRLVTWLERHRVLSRDGEQQKYGLGPRLVRWGQAYLGTLQLRDVARPVMEALHHDCGETVLLSQRTGDVQTFVEQITSRHEIKTVGEIGQGGPLYAGALGKAMLSALPAGERDAYLRAVRLGRMTPETITDRQVLRAELEQVRRQGYAFSRGERVRGIASMAAPILDHRGTVVGALAIVCPLDRFDRRKQPRFADRLRKAAAAISERLGHLPASAPRPALLRPAARSGRATRLDANGRLGRPASTARLRETSDSRGDARAPGRRG